MRTSEVRHYLKASGIKQTILEGEIKSKASIILRVHVNLITHKKLEECVCIFSQLKTSWTFICLSSHRLKGSDMPGTRSSRSHLFTFIYQHFCTTFCVLAERESVQAQSCLTLCDPMDCSPPGSSVYGISQARILMWVVNFMEVEIWQELLKHDTET